MRLNLQTDYALRLLMHLAVNEDHLSTIAEVAEQYAISKNHLMKVAHTLGREGVIETVRGRSGGLRLACPASKIVVGRIVRLMEADLALVECFQGGANECVITPACRLKGMLGEAVDAFLSILDQYTIENLVRRNRKLNTLLRVEAA
ncbi:MAG: Rrf2 family transcriptional regulator [Pseudomonadota bacterium]